jgi:hypothetical protein
MLMAMKLNREAFNHAKRLIKEGKVVKDGDWSEDQPSTKAENRFLDKHDEDFDDYGKWFLALDSEEKSGKGHYNFPYGDFKKVHRRGLIAAKQRAAQNDYTEIEKAADELLELIDGGK